MIERGLEAFFRHWVLILLPAILIPLDVAAAMLSTPPQYEASVGMWVQNAQYLSYSADDINRYLPPSQNQRNRLLELMQTRSFLETIAVQTPLAPTLEHPNADEELRQLFTRDFEASTGGDHLLILKFRAEDRAASTQVLTGIVDVFKTRAAADRYGQAQIAINFYVERVTRSEAELKVARADLSKYLTSNPTLAATLARAGTDAARADPIYAEYQRRVEASQSDADSARASLDRAELDVSAGVQGLELGFRIVDPVQASPSSTRQLRKVLIYPLLALVVGIIVSAGLLLLFTLSDHSVRSLADLATDAVIIGVLPRLEPKGVAGRPGAVATRRAIGFVAGAVLPLRRMARRTD